VPPTLLGRADKLIEQATFAAEHFGREWHLVSGRTRWRPSCRDWSISRRPVNIVRTALLDPSPPLGTPTFGSAQTKTVCTLDATNIDERGYDPDDESFVAP
jgi:hypothetical protein